MLGVGRKPPSVLDGILLCALPMSSLDNWSHYLGLLQEQIGRFIKSQWRPHHQVNHCIIHGLCRFCASAGILTPTACTVSRSRTREDFPQHKAVNRPPTPSKSRTNPYLPHNIYVQISKWLSDFLQWNTVDVNIWWIFFIKFSEVALRAMLL